MQNRFSIQESRKEQSVNCVEVDLSYFERRAAKPFLREYDNKLEICAGPNSIIVALGIRIIENCFINNMTDQLLKILMEKDIWKANIENIPKEYSSYSLEETLRIILVVAVKRIINMKNQKSITNSMQTEELIVTVFNYHPILLVCLTIFMRCKALSYFKGNESLYEAQSLGNEEYLLSNYNADVRNIPLHVVANSFEFRIVLKSEHLNQEYGKLNNTNVLTIKKHQLSWVLQKDSNQNYQLPRSKVRALIIQKYQEDCSSKKSSKDQIRQVEKSPKKKKNYVNVNIKSESQSESGSKSKQKVCPKCGKKKVERFCQCRKASTPKNRAKLFQGNHHQSNLNHSDFTSNMKKCKKCKIVKNLFMSDQYCGDCIGRYGIKRCKNCNNLFENKCEKCK